MRELLTIINHYWRSLTLILLISITTLSLWPLAQLPEVPGSDKTHHLIAYASLVFPCALKRPRFWGVWVVLFIGWSGAIELLQPYVNRYGEWLDMVANCAGIGTGIAAAWVGRRWLENAEG